MGEGMSETATSRRRRNLPYLWFACAIVFVIALAIRVYFLLRLPSDVVRPNADWELDSIVISMVETGRFADAYVVPTGPTAHLPPFAPFLKATICKVFGATLLGGYVSLVIQIVVQSAIWGLLPSQTNTASALPP